MTQLLLQEDWGRSKLKVLGDLALLKSHPAPLQSWLRFQNVCKVHPRLKGAVGMKVSPIHGALASSTFAQPDFGVSPPTSKSS